ncbi:hypothetical protein PLESTF_000607000 [Pleodorina starrii]|nr:hypothetical protein PLESTM_000666700 [Pleodorina starrii]GLC67784.1 hypothetical protein PLESTF_000607000 [Pleodorina starrii]
METDLTGVSGLGHGRGRVLKTVSRMPRTFINQLYWVDTPVTAWVSLGSLSYAACAFYLERQDTQSFSANLDEQVSSVAWTFQVQTAAFGAVLLLNLLNLGMRQHLLPFKCNLLLLYINGVAFVTDLLLWRGATTVLMSSSGRPFAPLRYVQWCHSTPTMIYMLALLADCSGWQLTIPLLSDVVMVLTGLAACYTAGLLKLVATLLSFGTFAVVLYYVYGMFQGTLSGDISPEQRCTLRTVLALLLALWSAFPVVWLAAELQLMGPQAEAVAWGVCDYLAKVVFSSQLWQSNLTEVQLRRDRALEVWEASNRVEAVTRLTALLKQRDDLLSTLSHELRTPLAGIVALSEGLCQEVSAALPSSAQNLATVRATATCMLSIVTSTLDSFAARRGGEPAAPGAAALLPYHHPHDDAGPVAPSVPLFPLDLRPLVETVMTVLRPLAHDGVAIVSDLPANLPQVVADVTRLSQVLYNLVGNAMRFTTQGEVRIAARIVLPEPSDGAAPAASPSAPPASAPSTRCADGAAGDVAASAAAAVASVNSISSSGGGGASGIWRYARPRVSGSSASSCSSHYVASLPPGTKVEISVEDTGVGIAQELLDELFLPYRTGQASAQGTDAAPDGGYTGRASKSIGGTGLGLYLVRLALRAQGSDITAESAPGIGSVFRFRLPVAPHPQPAQHSERHQSGRHAGLTQQQQRQRRGSSLDERRRVNDALSGSQAPLSGSACDCGGGEARSSRTLSGATIASEGFGAADCGGGGSSSPKLTPLSSPKPTPCAPASPKPWIASATARLVRLSAGRVGGSSGGASAAGPAEPQRARTGTFPLQGVFRPANSRMLRMSLDESHSRPPASCPPLPPQPPVGGGRCRFACADGCCTVAAEPSPVGRAAAGSAGGAAELESGSGSGDAADAAPAPTSADATAAASGGSGVAGGAPLAPLGTATSLSTPARLGTPALAPTPTQTPTAAAAGRISTATPFDVAQAIEEGRALARGGLRPNFRHRNNGVLQVVSVDDDPINQLVAGQMLTSQSWKVVKCMNGPEALAHLQLIPRPVTAAAAAAAAAAGAPSPTASLAAAAAAAAQALLLPAVLPDCVLLDVMMPGMSGFEVCRKLREHFTSAQLPIIIVSAKGDSAAVDEAFESGADDYMTKPYKRAEMVARIKAQIRTRDSLLEAAAAAAAAASAAPPAPPPPGMTAAAVCSAPPPGAAAAVAELPPQASSLSLGAVVASGATRAASSVLTARALLGGGGGSDLASPLPPPLSQDSRQTSVDALLLQQTTPDLIKMRMEANRGGLDGSWGKVGLYKREGTLSRTGAAPEPAAAPTSTCEGATRPGPTTDPATAPVALLASPCGGQAQGDAGSADAAAAAATAAATAAPQSSDSSGILNRRRALTADAVMITSRPLRVLPEGTVSAPSTEIDAAAAAAPGAMPPMVVLSAGALAATAETPVRRVASSAESPAVAAAGSAPAAADGSSAGGDANGGEPAAATALMHEVLTEVRRSRAVEADIEKLTSRVAALRTACCTLAAERDGWRRQARDLRALLAAGISGGAAAAEALAAGAAAPPTPGAAALSAKGTPLHLTLTEALMAAHGSRSSADSLGINIGGAGGGGGAAHGAPGGVVAAQLEDLKKEAALLRQQLSLALASVGQGSVCNGSLALGQGDTGGSRTFGLACSGAPPVVRPQRSLLPAPRMCDSPHSAAMPGEGAGAGEAERSGGGAGDGPPTWGVSVYPNPSFAPPDMFLTTQTSGLSAGSGPGCCASGDGGAAKIAPSFSHPSPGADGSSASCKQKRLLGRAAMGAAAAAAPGPRPAPTIPERSAAAKQANGVGGVGMDPPPPSSLAAFGSAVVCGVAEISLPAAAPSPPPPCKTAEPQPPILGELRGSSAASNGGRRSSVEEEMSQPSSAGRASGVAPSARGSRARGGGAGAAGGSGGGGTAGILRLLCSKGAVPSGSASSSPPRRPSQQQP